MSFTSKGTTELLAAGLQDTMLVIDLNKGEVMKQVCFHLAMPQLLTIPLTRRHFRSQPSINIPS